jgi:hypothetical protein
LGQEVGAGNEIVLQTAGIWDKQKKRALWSGNQAFIFIDRCSSRAHDIKLKAFEVMYEILVRSGMMCVVEMCEILEAWEVMI